MTTTIKAGEVLSALERLGASPNVVIAGLTQMGYKGDHSSDNCPLANYLRDQFPDAKAIAIGGTYTDGGILVGSTIIEYDDIPEAIVEFVCQFDTNQVPQLETFRGRWARRLHLK